MLRVFPSSTSHQSPGKGQGNGPAFQQPFLECFCYAHGYGHDSYFLNGVTVAQRGFPNSPSLWQAGTGTLHLTPVQGSFSSMYVA